MRETVFMRVQRVGSGQIEKISTPSHVPTHLFHPALNYYLNKYETKEEQDMRMIIVAVLRKLTSILCTHPIKLRVKSCVSLKGRKFGGFCGSCGKTSPYIKDFPHNMISTKEE